MRLLRRFLKEDNELILQMFRGHFQMGSMSEEEVCIFENVFSRRLALLKQNHEWEMRAGSGDGLRGQRNTLNLKPSTLCLVVERKGEQVKIMQIKGDHS